MTLFPYSSYQIHHSPFTLSNFLFSFHLSFCFFHYFFSFWLSLFEKSSFFLITTLSGSVIKAEVTNIMVLLFSEPGAIALCSISQCLYVLSFFTQAASSLTFRSPGYFIPFLPSLNVLPWLDFFLSIHLKTSAAILILFEKALEVIFRASQIGKEWSDCTPFFFLFIMETVRHVIGHLISLIQGHLFLKFS